MNVKPPKSDLKAGGLGKKIAKWTMYSLFFLALLYGALKFWEHQSSNAQRSSRLVMYKEQEKKYNILSSDLAVYAPLLAGTPAYKFAVSDAGKTIFTHLLSVDLDKFNAYLKEDVAISYVGLQLLGSGCANKECTQSQAAFVIDPEIGKWYAAILDKGHIVYYGVPEGAQVPKGFESWYKSHSLEAPK